MNISSAWLSETIPIFCSILVYPLSIRIIQSLILKPFRIAAHDNISPLIGFFTVLISSASATWVYILAKRFAEIGDFTTDFMSTSHVVASSLMCTLHLFILAGSFRVVVPSNILYPGAFYKSGTPCIDYSKQITASQRREINVIGRKYGCHTCGLLYPTLMTIVQPGRKTIYFADHSPPIAISHLYNEFSTGKLEGKLIPQCPNCSYLQAGCVKEILKDKTNFKNKKCFVSHAFTWHSFKLFLPWPLLISFLIDDYSVWEEIFVKCFVYV